MTDVHISKQRGRRKGLSPKTRFDVFKRDGFVCQYCGSHPPAVILHCDHVTPVKEGGTNDPSNLVTACEHCNQGKAAVPLSVIPESMADRAKRVQEAEAQIRGYNAILTAQNERVLDNAWDVIRELFGVEEIRKDWLTSVKRFVELIGLHECLKAAEIAAARNIRRDDQTFRYFCGICWAKART